MKNSKSKKPQQQKFEGIKVTTPLFRASFPFVFKPRPADEDKDKPQYTLAMLFPKSKMKEKAMVDFNNQITKAATLAFGPKEDWPDNFQRPWKDGDKKEDLEGYKGMWFIEAKSYNKPGVIDREHNEILDPNEFYGGCFAIATVVLKGYSYKGKNGVTVYLQNIKKMKDGERFGGRSNPADDFEYEENTDADDSDDFGSDNEPDFF